MAGASKYTTTSAFNQAQMTRYMTAGTKNTPPISRFRPFIYSSNDHPSDINFSTFDFFNSTTMAMSTVILDVVEVDILYAVDGPGRDSNQAAKEVVTRSL